MSATTQAGQLAVMAELLSSACEIIANVEPESTDEARRLAQWLDAAGRAVRSVKAPGVDIDAVHFRLTGD
jgi:hypothetical protein